MVRTKTEAQLKREFAIKYTKENPIKARLIVWTARFFVWLLELIVLFLAVTIVYAVFKWAIGVWI